MRHPRAAIGLVVAAVGALLLAGCAETELLVNTAKQAKGDKARPAGVYKVGSPYQIGGVWYYPKEEWDYTETGIASWYGPGFHGRSTANGETFDENEITAAHRTLPLPSVVRVTNLSNGRALVVRVNDRGPFAHGRIIDLSRRSAQLLGFDVPGTAKVRVEVLPGESRREQQVARGENPGGAIVASAADNAPAPTAVPPPPVQVARLEAPTGAASAPQRNTAPTPVAPPSATAGGAVALAGGGPTTGTLETVPVKPTDIWIQVGSFESRENAGRLSTRMRSFGPARVQEATVAGKTFFRVRIGPMTEVAGADQVLERVIAAGYPGSRIIVD